ncbi:uncharacterized protein LOC135348488 isoform X3 [Halichondria panicea]|uniref:uncharacterized protein LOC135348488 isoform X3 n=1 Tax=Halichondria panicea TaxID=6063 RepID=UPI00312BAA2E
MVFGHKSSFQYLVTASETHLQVWDLLSCSVLWCVKTRVCSMVSDPLSQLTAVFVPSGNDPPSTHCTYLVSGGEEGVLVLWKLDTHKREFHSRLGSPITHLACSPGDKYFTVGLQSNVVQVVSGVDTEMEWTIGGLRRSHIQTVNQNGINTGLGICPRSINSSDQQYARVHPVLRPSQGVSHPTKCDGPELRVSA